MSPKPFDQAVAVSCSMRLTSFIAARQFHAAPMGLKTVLFGLAYYNHVAPTELAAAAQQVIGLILDVKQYAIGEG